MASFRQLVVNSSRRTCCRVIRAARNGARSAGIGVGGRSRTVRIAVSRGTRCVRRAFLITLAGRASIRLLCWIRAVVTFILVFLLFQCISKRVFFLIVFLRLISFSIALVCIFFWRWRSVAALLVLSFLVVFGSFRLRRLCRLLRICRIQFARMAHHVHAANKRRC